MQRITHRSWTQPMQAWCYLVNLSLLYNSVLLQQGFTRGLWYAVAVMHDVKLFSHAMSHNGWPAEASYGKLLWSKPFAKQASKHLALNDIVRQLHLSIVWPHRQKEHGVVTGHVFDLDHYVAHILLKVCLLSSPCLLSKSLIRLDLSFEHLLSCNTS